jgi:hypothetical protein
MALLGCFAVALLGASPTAQGPSTYTVKAFNGTSLSGWQPQGAAQWRVAGGEIVGTASGTPGWLVFDTPYQDIILNFEFKCDGCDAGVVLRRAALASQAGQTTQLYAGVSGPDTRQLYRVTLNGQNQEVDRTQLFEWTTRRNPPGMRLQITERPDGWMHVRALARGDITAPDAGQTGSTSVAGPAATPESLPNFGPLAIQVKSGELHVRNVEVTDLLRPVAGLNPEVTSPGFRKILLTDRFYSEGISAGDVNNDNVMDAASGAYAYLGPDFKLAMEIYPPQLYAIGSETQGGRYTDNFLNYLHDFNGDGWDDYLKVNFNGAYLYVNPKGQSRHWDMYDVAKRGVSSETTQLGDLDGDGKPELLMSTGSGAERQIGYLKPGADVTQPWTFVPVSEQGDWGGHGYGYGDVNGDGQTDVLQGSGWWEQPAAGAASGLWTFHADRFRWSETDPFLAGSDMFAYDLNGDGLNDVITSNFAHGPGFMWYEQKRTGNGPITWTMHKIMDSPDVPVAERGDWAITDKSVAFTELHAISLVDMDGDGLKDIVTGKRWWSHGIETPENDRDDPGVLYWFKTIRGQNGQVAFEPHLINNYVALGTQIATADMNGDGRPDVLTAARKGAYIFLNLGPSNGSDSASR